MKSHYPGCMSDEECKCQDYDDEIEDEQDALSDLAENNQTKP